MDVETLLEGSIRKADNRLRITAQLIKVADGSHIWSERYDREMKDVFAIQDEISLAIADNLKVKLLGETKAMIAKRHSENLEAYNLYLKGTYCYQMMTVEGFKKASEYFDTGTPKRSRLSHLLMSDWLQSIGLAPLLGKCSTKRSLSQSK